MDGEVTVGEQKRISAVSNILFLDLTTQIHWCVYFDNLLNAFLYKLYFKDTFIFKTKVYSIMEGDSETDQFLIKFA